jgi:hypothetical protein
MAVYTDLFISNMVSINQTLNNADQTTVITLPNTGTHGNYLKRLVLNYGDADPLTIKIGLSESTSGTAPFFIRSYTDTNFAANNKIINVIENTLYLPPSIQSIVIVTNTVTGGNIYASWTAQQIPAAHPLIANTLITAAYGTVTLPINPSSQTITLASMNENTIIKSVYLWNNTSTALQSSVLQYQPAGGTFKIKFNYWDMSLPNSPTGGAINMGIGSAWTTNLILETTSPITVSTNVGYIINFNEVE